MSGSLTIDVANAGRRATAICSWRQQDQQWVVRLDGPFGAVEGTGPDAFEALLKAREQVEPDGWRIGVTGACADVWPSGMARDMGAGLVAYRLPDDRRPTREDLVDVFSPTDPDVVVDVQGQRAATTALMRRPR
jgi:hypothetical protein